MNSKDWLNNFIITGMNLEGMLVKSDIISIVEHIESYIFKERRYSQYYRSSDNSINETKLSYIRLDNGNIDEKTLYVSCRQAKIKPKSKNHVRDYFDSINIVIKKILPDSYVPISFTIETYRDDIDLDEGFNQMGRSNDMRTIRGLFNSHLDVISPVVSYKINMLSMEKRIITLVYQFKQKGDYLNFQIIEESRDTDTSGMIFEIDNLEPKNIDDIVFFLRILKSLKNSNHMQTLLPQIDVALLLDKYYHGKVILSLIDLPNIKEIQVLFDMITVY